MNVPNVLLWLLIIFMPCVGYGQDLSFIKKVEITQPVSVSIDRYNHIFTSDQQGNVYKYDSTANILQVYSSQKVAGVPMIEAWPTIQIFIFYRDLQRFTFLNRFLTEPQQSAGFDPGKIGFGRAATIASDDQLWIFDESDFSLKKLNPVTQQLSLHVPLGLILTAANYNINHMREYQNLLFVNDINSGILIFDNFGNYKKKLPFTEVRYFSFYGNELYVIDKNTLHFFDLYTLSRRSIALPAGINFDYALVFDTQIVLFSKNKIYIYQHKIK